MIFDSRDEEAFRRILKGVLSELATEVFNLRPAALVKPEPPAAPERLLLRPAEAADALAISERHLSKLCAAGKIPCVRITRLVRFDPVALREWIRLPDSARMLDTVRGSAEARKSKSPSGDERKMAHRTRQSRRGPTNKLKQPEPKVPPVRQASRISHDEPKPRLITAHLAERLGVDIETFPSLTNGEIMRIGGIDMITLHNWTWRNGEMPQAAWIWLENHFAQLLKVHRPDSAQP